MKISFIIFIFSVIVLAESAEFEKNKDEYSLYSFFKDRIMGKLEEYGENYDHFVYLMKSLKHHFYDNYNNQPKEEFKLVKRESPRVKRTL